MPKLLKTKIIISQRVFGKGTKEDPSRLLTELHTEDGEIICTYDPLEKVSDVCSYIQEML